MISKLNEVNKVAILISVITIVIIFWNNDWLKPRVSRSCALPVPIELIAVVTGTLLSQCLSLEEKYGVRTIGHIPTGFPGLYIFFEGSNR